MPFKFVVFDFDGTLADSIGKAVGISARRSASSTVWPRNSATGRSRTWPRPAR